MFHSVHTFSPTNMRLISSPALTRQQLSSHCLISEARVLWYRRILLLCLPFPHQKYRYVDLQAVGWHWGGGFLSLPDLAITPAVFNAAIHFSKFSLARVQKNRLDPQ